MRAIEYGIKKFGGFSFNDSLTNIIVFNENITVEDPDKIQHVSQVKYLVECTLNGNVFTIKSDGDILTFEEFIYLSETNVENIEKLKHLININGISSIRTIYKVNDQYFIFYDFSTVESLELNEEILSPEDKNPKKIIKTKPVLLNEKLKENKQTIIFFISSNGALIENAFKEIDQIRKNELVFFIEDKAESNIFGSVVRIASGSGFTSIQNIPFKEISKVVNVYEKSIRSVDFEFMLKDHFNDKSGTLYLVKRVFFGLISEVIIIKDNLPLTVVEVFAETLAGLLSKLQFNETTWKYYDDEGNVAKNNAILLPEELLDTKNLKKENIQVYTKKLNEIEQLLKQSLQANRALIKDNKIFKKIITKIYDVIDSINDFISSSFGKGMEITKNFLIFYNAYIIGLINGFLKAVEDFFVLIAQLAKAIKFVQSETKKGNASNYWVMFFESIENFYDLLSNLITVKNLVALGSFLKKCLLLSPLVTYMAIHYFLENDFSITSDRLGYYIGYAIGIIIELIVETILTGGATTVEQAVKLVFNQLKMIVQKLSKKVISFSDNIIEGIITVYAKLKHLFKNFPQFLDDLFELILNWVRKLEDFMAIFSKETLALFGKHGVDIRKVPQAALYAGIPIPVGDNVYALMREGKEIFRGTKSEVDYFANHLKKMSDTEAKKFLDDIAKGNKLKLAEKMWKDFTYEDLIKIPPSKKPCFLAGTLVKTENGNLPIEQLKVGNKVFTYNLEKKQTKINAVTRVYENVTQKYLKIKTQNSCIEATGQHRFWIPKQEKWLMANELKTGMHFLDTHKNLVEILTLEIIENTEKTYNLEIENNHNYFVGQDEILTHNTNKVFKFADETLYDFGFYRLVEAKGDKIDDLYVGITTQPFDVRNSQHAQEGKAALPPKNQKPYNAWKANADLLRIKPDYTKMTFYEATVWETYFINERGGGKAHKGLGKLLNRKTPISEKMFDDMKKTGKFNPCKYFI